MDGPPRLTWLEMLEATLHWPVNGIFRAMRDSITDFSCMATILTPYQELPVDHSYAIYRNANDMARKAALARAVPNLRQPIEQTDTHKTNATEACIRHCDVPIASGSTEVRCV